MKKSTYIALIVFGIAGLINSYTDIFIMKKSNTLEDQHYRIKETVEGDYIIEIKTILYAPSSRHSFIGTNTNSNTGWARRDEKEYKSLSDAMFVIDRLKSNVEDRYYDEFGILRTMKEYNDLLDK